MRRVQATIRACHDAGISQLESARPIVREVKAANAAFRFGLEMVTLAVFVWWGFATEDGPAALLRGFGVALLTVAVWGTFGAPNAPLRAQPSVRLALLAVAGKAGRGAFLDRFGAGEGC